MLGKIMLFARFSAALADFCTTPCNPLWITHNHMANICYCFGTLSTCNADAGTCSDVFGATVCEGQCEVSSTAIGLIVGSIVLVLLCCCACAACCRTSETHNTMYVRMPAQHLQGGGVLGQQRTALLAGETTTILRS
jgi:hypothetical protein